MGYIYNQGFSPIGVTFFLLCYLGSHQNGIPSTVLPALQAEFGDFVVVAVAAIVASSF